MSIEQTRAALARYPVTMVAEEVDPPEGVTYFTSFYEITLGYEGRTLTTPFHCTTGELSVELVLNALLSDAHLGEGGFEDFCNETIADPDNPKDWENFYRIVDQTQELQALLQGEFEAFLYGPAEEPLTICKKCGAFINPRFGEDEVAAHLDTAGTEDDPRSPGDYDDICDVCGYRE